MLYEIEILGKPMRYNKYSNKKTNVDGIIFDSRAEARRYRELKSMEQAGLIKSLVLQPKFLLQDKFKYNGKTYRKIEYIADFGYIDTSTGQIIVEDVKGMETDVFKLKMKMFLSLYGDTVDFKVIKE